jgi:hypothetical protein
VFSGLYADKAQTLLNKRTLWGNNFDGSADIGGQLIPFENGNSDIGSQKIQFRTIYLKSYVWLGSDQEGIYLDKSGIYLHNSDNSYKGMVMKFDESGNTTAHHNLQVIGATTLKSTLSVVGATTLQSTLLVKDLATFDKSILLANANTIGFKHTDGQSNINLLSLTENNEARFGYGTLAKGLTSTIYGKEIQFKTKDSLNNDAVIDDNGNFHSYHDISATGGVSASGVNDFGIGGGSVGTGGKTYKLTKIDGVTNTTLELSATDGSQTETIAFNQFGSSFAGIVPATNGAPKTSVLSTEGWRILTANDIPNLDWSKITTGKPTTLGGYGITDAFTKSQIENGVFPNMRVGLADDLGDIEETLDEEYTFQPTANPNEIRDGYAQIESLKGNSLVWNQLLTNNVDTLINGSAGSANPNIRRQIFKLKKPTIVGRIYACVIQLENFVDFDSDANAGSVRIFRYDDILKKECGTIVNKFANESLFNQGKHYATYIETVDKVYDRIYIDIAQTDNTNYSQATLQLIDLTQMFGEGYEPTTVEEFERRCPKGMPMDYNEGEVIHFNGDIKSVGFNQFNKDDVEEGCFYLENLEKIVDSKLSSIKIRVLPNILYYTNIYARKNVHSLLWLDKDNQFINGALGNISSNNGALRKSPPNAYYARLNVANEGIDSFVFNISDPDKNGTYEPYTEFRRDLPTELFEGGMKSAGTAHDEIYWDKSKGKYIKVTRIGSVDLGS